MKNVKYGKCVRCGKTYEARPDLTNCECGGILDIVYDYDYIRSVLTKEKLARRENRSMWRYRELLPVEEPDYGPEINRRNRKIVAVTEIVLTVLVTAIFIAQLVTGEMFLWRLF